MKSQNKTKTKAKNRISIKPRLAGKSKLFLHGSGSKLRHFRLVKHSYTGTLIHHKHTSHLSLAIILAVVGIFVIGGGFYVNAQTVASNLSVSALVLGPPPQVGANITSPINNTKVLDKKTIDVSGTCAADTFVVVKNNDMTAGSTICSSEGFFSLVIQIQVGKNVLSALNYDNNNQVGPETASVTVFLTESGDLDHSITPIKPIQPVIPDNPSIVPDPSGQFDDCNDYQPMNLEAGGDPMVAVVCVPRFVNPGIKQVMGILVWGGEPPYAVNISWGDNLTEDTLMSVTRPAYRTVPFSYALPGVYKISIRMTDKNSQSAVVQTAVQTYGNTDVLTESPISAIIDTPWFKVSVPLYVMALTTTIGFWAGDLFDRYYGQRKNKRKAT